MCQYFQSLKNHRDVEIMPEYLVTLSPSKCLYYSIPMTKVVRVAQLVRA